MLDDSRFWIFLQKGRAIDLVRFFPVSDPQSFRLVARDRQKTFVKGFRVFYFRVGPLSFIYPEIERDKDDVDWEVRHLDFHSPTYTIFVHISGNIGISCIHLDYPQRRRRICYDLVRPRVMFPQEEESRLGVLLEKISVSHEEAELLVRHIVHIFEQLKDEDVRIDQVLAEGSGDSNSGRTNLGGRSDNSNPSGRLSLVKSS